MSLLANSNAIETGGYQISRSVRLRSSATAYFSRTPGSAGNQQRFTLSAWVKLGTISTNRSIINCWSGNQYFDVRFDSGNSFYVLAADSGGSLITNISTSAVYRDPSAWYHVMVSVDTTQATANNRVILYINGAQPNTTYTTTPTQNYSYILNSTNLTTIGKRAIDSTQLFDGYLTEINFVDGSALTPSSFGQTDTITGSWVAKKYTGTYGTNGFYLNFSDNSAATSTTIGKDYSGNGNNWTPNNISVTAGATYDSMLDVPTLYADGGNGRGNYCAWNYVANTGATITDGNLKLTRADALGWRGPTGTIASSTGKWYAEFTIGGVSEISIGVVKAYSSQFFGNNNQIVGQQTSNEAWGYAYDGYKWNQSTQTNVTTTYTTNDVVMVAFDADAGKVWFGVNGTWIGSGSPSTGANAAYSNLSIGEQYTFCSTLNGTASIVNANFGQRPFAYTPPTGFKALNTTNLSDPTVKDGGDYFNTVLWTGNDATRTITGYGFQPDFIWTKGRNVAAGHRLSDAVRGASGGTMLNLNTASTAGENTDTAITGFASDGFTMNGTNHPNVSPYTYVGWGWKANGTGVSNTAGSITSTVSANTTSGFSIATTTGTGGTGTIGHGLGAVPQFIMCFRRNTAADHYCYHQAIGNTNFLILNSTAASAASANLWNNTTPTSTVFSVGNTNNNSGDTYVHYIFAPISGYSAFGSYTGNGSTDGIFIYLGFKPRFIMIKRTDTTADWVIYDSARDTYNVNTLTLYPNLSSAEGVVNPANDFLSNGFKARNLTSTFNASGGTYIYAAFGDAFKFSNAR